jgi:hypothetical protein
LQGYQQCPDGHLGGATAQYRSGAAGDVKTCGSTTLALSCERDPWTDMEVDMGILELGMNVFWSLIADAYRWVDGCC